jgi:Beta-lactamase
LSERTNWAPGTAAYRRPMPDVDEIGGWITGQLPAPIAKYKVVGAAIGVFRGKEAEVPPLGLMGTQWGFGFELFDFPCGFIFGHDGSTIGQSAFLRIVPGKDLAIVLLANGGNLIGQYFDVYGHLLKELAGIDLSATPVPSASRKRIDAIRYLGVCANSIGKSTVTQDCNGQICMTDELIGEVEQTELVHLEGDTLIPLEPKYGIRIPQVFSGDDGSGRSLYIHSGRALRRAD